MNTPFKTNGIYARKMNPESELINYKPTKLGSIWKAAIGETENAYYDIVRFIENYSFSEDNYKEGQFCADYSCITGEIFEIADGEKKRGSFYAKYKNVYFSNNYFEFGAENLLFSGYINNDILNLKITNRETGKSVDVDKFRYIPWI